MASIPCVVSAFQRTLRTRDLPTYLAQRTLEPSPHWRHSTWTQTKPVEHRDDDLINGICPECSESATFPGLTSISAFWLMRRSWKVLEGVIMRIERENVLSHDEHHGKTSSGHVSNYDLQEVSFAKLLRHPTPTPSPDISRSGTHNIHVGEKSKSKSSSKTGQTIVGQVAFMMIALEIRNRTSSSNMHLCT